MRRASLAVALLVGSVGLSGCGLFGDDGDGTSVFDAEPGMCFHALTEVEAQVDDLDEVACTKQHALEAFALVSYAKDGDAFPGADDLAAFADGHCAREFRDYVGVDYLDSSLYFTYLLPSPRSWEEDDREVLCLVTTAGEPLTESVKGSKR